MNNVCVYAHYDRSVVQENTRPLEDDEECVRERERERNGS